MTDLDPNITNTRTDEPENLPGALDASYPINIYNLDFGSEKWKLHVEQLLNSGLLDGKIQISGSGSEREGNPPGTQNDDKKETENLKYLILLQNIDRIIAELEYALEQIRARRAEIAHEIKTIDAEITNLHGKLDTVFDRDEQIQNLRNKKKGCHDEYGRCTQNITDQKQKVEDAEQHAKDTQSDPVASDKEKEKAKRDAKAEREKLTKLEKEKATLEEEIEDLERQIEERKTAILGENPEAKDIADRIEELEAQKTALNAEDAKLEAQEQAIEEELAALREIQALEQRAELTQSTYDKTMAAFQKTRDWITRDSETQRSAHEDTQKALCSIQKEQSALKLDITATTQEGKLLGEAITEALKQFTIRQNALGEVQEEWKAAQRQQEQLNALQEKMADMTEKYDTIQDALNESYSYYAVADPKSLLGKAGKLLGKDSREDWGYHMANDNGHFANMDNVVTTTSGDPVILTPEGTLRVLLKDGTELAVTDIDELIHIGNQFLNEKPMKPFVNLTSEYGGFIEKTKGLAAHLQKKGYASESAGLSWEEATEKFQERMHEISKDMLAKQESLEAQKEEIAQLQADQEELQVKAESLKTRQADLERQEEILTQQEEELQANLKSTREILEFDIEHGITPIGYEIPLLSCPLDSIHTADLPPMNEQFHMAVGELYRNDEKQIPDPDKKYDPVAILAGAKT